MELVVGDRSHLSEAVVLQCAVHGPDDIVALSKGAEALLGLRRDRPFARPVLGREPQTLQRASPLDQERAITAQFDAHVFVRAKIRELGCGVLFSDEHPVEPGEAFGIYLALKLARHLLLRLAAQLQRDHLARPLADAVSDIVAGDVEALAVVGHAANEDVGVRVPGVVVIDGDPIESGPEVRLHLRHQPARGLAKVGQLDALLSGYDETELVPIFAPVLQESTAVGYVLVSRVDLALFAVASHAVALKVAEVGVHGFGAHMSPRPRGPALRVEFDDPSLDRDAAHSGTNAASVPAPGAPALQPGRNRSTPAARIAPPAFLPGPARPGRVTSCSPDRLLHLAGEGLGPRSHGARKLRAANVRAAISDPTRTDTKTVFIGRHGATIGGEN